MPQHSEGRASSRTGKSFTGRCEPVSSFGEGGGYVEHLSIEGIHQCWCPFPGLVPLQRVTGVATGEGALCCHLVPDVLTALLATAPKVRLISWPRRKD